jgi:hypothetical protein
MPDKKETNYDRYIAAEAEKERLSKAKTPARKIAESMELEQTYPMTSRLAKKLDAIPPEERKTGYALQSGLGIPASMMADMVTGPKSRSDEDMSELTREVSRAQGKKKGGKITHYKSASAAVKAAEKRGDKSITVKFNHRDGIAQRGHTKGRMR